MPQLAVDLLTATMAMAVIISPRVEQRKNLEAFFSKLSRLGGLKGVSSLNEGKQLIQNANNPDYVFLSDELERTEREKFIHWIRARKSGKRTVFITICAAVRPDVELLADHLAAGTHGVNGGVQFRMLHANP